MHKNQEKKKTIIRLRLSPVFRELHEKKSQKKSVHEKKKKMHFFLKAPVHPTPMGGTKKKS